MQNNLIKL